MQSTAALVLSAQGKIDFPVHLFCNVGDDSEDPLTLAYVNDVLKPYAAERGIEYVELHRHTRDGAPETLFGRLTKPGSRSLPIPVRMSNGAPGTRSCTMDFKLRVIAKWHKEHGASPETPGVVGIGFSFDEVERVGKSRHWPWETIEYPLLDLRLSRDACQGITERAGLPPAPKSSCWFCPFHRPQTWREMRRDRPELFERAAQLEDSLNGRRDRLEKDHVYFTRFARPLREAIAEAQTPLFEGDGGACEDGVCFH